jgi:hypothetical protein
LENSAVGTEILGLQLALDGPQLVLSCGGDQLIAFAPLSAADAERLRMEMAKAQLWEWNQFAQQKAHAELRYRRYLGSWLVMCLAAFSVYVGFPDFYLPIFFSLISIFLWWRAGHEEQRAEREAQAQRNAFRAEWDYISQRLEEEGTSV